MSEVRCPVDLVVGVRDEYERLKLVAPEEDPTLVFSSLGGDLEEMVNHSDSSVSTMGLLLWLSERGLGWTDIIVTKVHSGSSCGALCVREWS